jgi:hypothetical protein
MYAAKANNPATRRARAHRVLPALVAGLALLCPTVASAQTPQPFQATATYTGTLPSAKAGGCPNGAYFCGTATIAGYGPASWNLYLTSNTNVDSPCGSTYTAVTEFTLADAKQSTLVLDESGDLCGLGHDGAAYRGYFAQGSNAFGHPYDVVGTWTVDTADSSGVFTGVGGSGTDTMHVAGAYVAGSYSGTLS